MRGLERRDDRGAAAGLDRHQPRQRAAHPAQLDQLIQCLVDADHADAAAGGVNDDVRHGPAKLLDDLQAHRLLALEPIRLFQRRNLLIAPAARNSGIDQPAAVADMPAHQVELGPRRGHLAPADGRRLLGHGNQRADPGTSRIQRPRRASVPVRRHGNATHAELGRHGDAHRGTARLKRAGGDRPLVFHQQLRYGELLAQPRQRQQRCHALAQAHDVLLARHRQQLVISPQRGLTSGERSPRRFGGQPGEVVLRQQRRAAGAQPLHDIGPVAGATAGTAQVGQVREHQAAPFRSGLSGQASASALVSIRIAVHCPSFSGG